MSENTALECRNLVKSFGGVHAVEALSVTFEAGRIAALIGPNGAGKTTLFHLLTGTLQPDGGEIYYRGQRIDGRPPWQLARMGIGRLFQDVRVFGKLTATENVLAAFGQQTGENPLWAMTRRWAVGREERARADEAQRLLELVGLAAKAFEPAGALSYGQQKLLAMARLLASDAHVLLLDEPTSGVNPEMVAQLLDLIRRLDAENKTVILIEHNMSVVREIAEWVYFLEEGRLTASGLPETVLEDRNVRAAYLGLA